MSQPSWGSPRTAQLHDWLTRMRAGDERAHDELLRSVTQRLEVLARRMLNRFPQLRRWEQTDDVLQGALLGLFNALREVRPESMRSFYNLSSVMIRRQLIDLWRHYYGPRGLGTHHHSDPSAPARAPAPQDDFPDIDRVHELVDQLPEDQREVFELRYYHDLSQDEVAESLGIVTRTVQRRWVAAVCQLHSLLEREEGHLPGSPSQESCHASDRPRQ
jgi:RNA polymerase sigma factor (sigma-70 family)